MNQDLLFKLMSDKWLRLVVLLLLLAGLAYQISLLFWHYYPVPDVSASNRPLTVKSNTGSTSATPNYQQQAAIISRAYLFGQAAVQQQVAVVAEEAPETQLNYKLRGIYYSGVGRLSSAIVEVQPNNSKHYLLDDELAENITLAGIERDHILINRYGKIERLNLQKPIDKNGGSLISTSSNSGSPIHTALLQSYKKRYVSNPMALATRFQAIPVQQDGKNIGFKLKPLRGESLLRKLNFEPNDVFTAVNGVALNNPFEAVDALKSLTTSQSVSVTFIRNGSEQTTDFKL